MSTNYSLYAIPASWFLATSVHWYAASLTARSKDLPAFDNCSPREFNAKCRALEKQTPVVAKYLRAEAAQQNGFENVPFFAAAVLAGNLARLPSQTMNLFVGGYLASRVAYNLLYIHTTNIKLSGLRTLAFTWGILGCCNIFFKAGNALNELL